MSKVIVFTGGGTAGHVTPNVALIEVLQKEGWQCFYIGSHQSIEKELMNQLDIPFYGIATGKLRRYFSFQNFIDPFKILFGIAQSLFFLRRIKPSVVFSKGGFVSLPVVIAAWLSRLPAIAHESDLSPGLTTKLSYPFVSCVCITFERAANYFKHKKKLVVTGTPLRVQLFNGVKEKGFNFCGFKQEKPCLLFAGGGLGSVAINLAVRESLESLLPTFNIIHLCGHGKIDPLIKQEGYCQFDYVNEEMPDLYALSDLVISRSGANTVCEILALKKPHVFIPLSLKASRGDQIHNANYCLELGVSQVLNEEDLTSKRLCEAIGILYAIKDEKIRKMQTLKFPSGVKSIVKLIKKY